MKKLFLSIFILSVSMHAVAQWTQLSDSKLQGMGKGLLARHGSYVYTATDGGIYRADLSAASWTYKSNGLYTALNSLSIAKLVSNSAAIYAIGEQGLVRSTDNGDNWSLAVSGIPAGAYFLELVEFDDNLYLAVQDGLDAKIYSSLDNAATWNEVFVFTSYEYRFAGTPTGLYFMDAGSFVYSTDGVSFSNVPTSNLPSNIENITGDDEFIYVTTSDSGGVYSMDTLGNFVHRDNGLPGGGIPFRILNINDTLFLTVVNFAAGNMSIYRSVDQAATWVKMAATGMHIPAAYAGVPGNGNILIHATEGVYSSADGGNTWSYLVSGAHASSHTGLLASGNNLISIEYMREVIVSTDKGSTFSYPSDINTQMVPQDIFATKNVVVVGFNNFIGDTAQIYKTSNHGANWVKLNVPPGSLAYFLKGTSDSSIFISGPTLYRSDDTGASWVQITHPPLNFLDQITGNSSMLHATGFSFTGKYLYESTDKGQTWTEVTTGLPPGSFGLNIAYLGNLVFTVVSGDIYKRVGSGWTLLTTSGLGTGNEVNTLGYFEGKLFASTKNGVYYSTDQGAGWQAFSSTGYRQGLNIGSMAFIDHDLFAGTFGSGIWKAVNPVAGVPAHIISNQTLEIYPNPASFQTTITYQLTSKSMVSMELFDLAGRMVMAPVSEMQQAGEHSLQINTSQLAPGFYSLVCRNGEAVTTKKLIISK
jgi:photosystem II stability/assembly factor-like uncharacterized protein